MKIGYRIADSKIVKIENKNFIIKGYMTICYSYIPFEIPVPVFYTSLRSHKKENVAFWLLDRGTFISTINFTLVK